jgi:hypothetical protein
LNIKRTNNCSRNATKRNMCKSFRMHGMAAKSLNAARSKAAKRMTSERGKYMRRCKGARHSHETKRAIGDYHFMHLVRWTYMRRLGRKLTPAELAWVRATHKDEIAASCKGERWVKKPRVTAPGTWT